MDPGSSVFRFGKHKDKTFESVLKSDSGYCRWVCDQENASGQLSEFKEYVKSNRSTTLSSSQSSSPGRTSVTSQPSSNASCLIFRTEKGFKLSLQGFLDSEKWRELAGIPGLIRINGSSREWDIPAEKLEEITKLIKIPVQRSPEWVERVQEDFQKTLASPVDPGKCAYIRDFPQNILMDFQRETVQFALSRNGKCLIAHEMGLGKSLCALAVAYEYRKEWPLLVICPSSIRFVWCDQIKKWLPNSSKLEIQVITKGSDLVSSSADIIIISYQMVTKDVLPTSSNFKVVICDESHYIKDLQTKRAKSVVPIIKKSKRALLLSGTPLMNRAEEVYSQFSSLLPFKSPTLSFFRERYCRLEQFRVPSTGFLVQNYVGCENKAELNALLTTTVMFRKTKNDVALQLPEKIRHRVVLDSAMDSSTSREISKLTHKWQERKEQQQAPGFEGYDDLIELWRLTGKTKLPKCLEYIEELINGNSEKMILFAHHKFVMDGLVEAVKGISAKENFSFMNIDGSTPQNERSARVEKFQNDPNCKLAILSITACAEGITLTAANIVIFCELYWTPGIMEQAESRAHRVGSKSTVFVHYLILPGSPDELVFNTIEKKKRDTSAILNGKAAGLEAIHQIGSEISSSPNKRQKIDVVLD
jgi:SNF2 family DNA or RNA helicase